MAVLSISPEVTIISVSSAFQGGLPAEMKDELAKFEKIHTLGGRLPSAQTSSEDIEVHSLDDVLSDEDDPERFNRVAEMLLADAWKQPLLLLVGDGDPGKAEVCGGLFKAAAEQRCRLRVFDVNGALGALLMAAGLETGSQFSVADAGRLASSHHPSFPPGFPAIIPDLKDGPTVGKMKPVLLAVYPRNTPSELSHRDAMPSSPSTT